MKALELIQQLIPELQGVSVAARTLQARETAVGETELELSSREVDLIAREKVASNREQAADSLRKELSNARASIQAGLDREKKLADKLESARKERDEYKARITAIESAFPQLTKLESAPVESDVKF